MSAPWRIVDSGPGDAAFNMALDEAIATSVRQGNAPPTLRVYAWNRPCVSLGCFQKSTDIDVSYCRDSGLLIVRRPTGGRAVLHTDDVTYSFSVPTTTGPFSRGLLDSYEKISSALVSALSRVGLSVESKKSRKREKSGERHLHNPLCFLSVSFGEITLNGIKVIGSAQKRWKEGLLQQGSIPLSVGESELFAIVPRRTREVAGGNVTGLKRIMPELSREALTKALWDAFRETFGVELVNSPPTEREISLAQDLEAHKYRSHAWTFRR